MGSPQPPAALSLLVVRWWDYWNPKNRRSRTHNVTNEDLILDVMELQKFSPHAAFAEGGGYEVHSAFIRESADLARIGGAMAAAMRGKCRSAFYFLWPVQRPAIERRMDGAVAEPALLGLMERMEAAGVRSCWPHPVSLYRQLAGKLWTPRVCRERPDLRVLPTVLVDGERWEADPYLAADDAIKELRALREAQPSEAGPVTDPYRGVAKLGFSWMGQDVKPFTGAAELVKVLRQLLDGAPKGAVCLVQERLESSACELRFICCRDLATGKDEVQRELVRMSLKPPMNSADETFALTGHTTMTAAEATQVAFRGNAQALAQAEEQAGRLADLWLQWFRDSGYGTPASCRLDFLVAVTEGRATGSLDVRVWTVELCECGGSLCGIQVGPRTAAVLNECLLGDSTPAGFPQPLPPFRVEASQPPAAQGESMGGTATANTKGRGAKAPAVAAPSAAPAASPSGGVLVRSGAGRIGFHRRRLVAVVAATLSR